MFPIRHCRTLTLQWGLRFQLKSIWYERRDCRFLGWLACTLLRDKLRQGMVMQGILRTEQLTDPFLKLDPDVTIVDT